MPPTQLQWNVPTGVHWTYREQSVGWGCVPFLPLQLNLKAGKEGNFQWASQKPCASQFNRGRVSRSPLKQFCEGRTDGWTDRPMDGQMNQPKSGLQSRVAQKSKVFFRGICGRPCLSARQQYHYLDWYLITQFIRVKITLIIKPYMVSLRLNWNACLVVTRNTPSILSSHLYAQRSWAVWGFLSCGR